MINGAFERVGLGLQTVYSVVACAQVHGERRPSENVGFAYLLGLTLFPRRGLSARRPTVHNGAQPQQGARAPRRASSHLAGTSGAPSSGSGWSVDEETEHGRMLHGRGATSVVKRGSIEK